MKFPSKEWLTAQIKKNFWKRLAWLFFCVFIYLLGDERLKEGYWFRIEDITNIHSHEFWIAICLLASLISYLIHRIREVKGEESEGGGTRGN